MKDNLEGRVNVLTNHLFRENHGKMVAYLAHQYGYQHLDDIMDAVQETFEAALLKWKFSGIPANSFAWLYRVARNKLLNRIKQLNVGRQYLESLGDEEVSADDDQKELADTTLKLLVFFSKIDFPQRNKLIISLYYLCGFGYVEIAHAMILQVDAVKKVILRSRAAIKKFALRYEGFHMDAIAGDLSHLMTIVYLLFNEGYKTCQKNSKIKYDLCHEAIRLAKLIHHDVPCHPELNSLLALLLFNTSRFPARIDDSVWVSLIDQDRKLWNRALIAEGFYHLNIAKDHQVGLSRYYLEALISSLHCSAASYQQTDWPRIVFLYQQLERLLPNAVAIKLNRIVAQSNFGNLVSLLLEMDALESSSLPQSAFAFYSSKAHLQVKLQNWQLAAENYRFALPHTKNLTDVRYINQKLNDIALKLQGIS